MEIGIFFFVTLIIYTNVHQELLFTGGWKCVYYNDFYTQASCITRAQLITNYAKFWRDQKITACIMTLVRFYE